MKLIFIRHGDPDYENDTLTETGWIEAEAAAQRIAAIDRDCGGIKAIYVSTMGRARDTASCSLKKLGRKADGEFEWLREFSTTIDRPHKLTEWTCTWDWLPADWTCEPIFYDADHWAEHPIMAAGHVKEEYERVCGEFDKLLARHGYERCNPEEGQYYHVREANEDALVFFCHFGLECVLMSHLMHCSPMVLWHGFVSAPTGFSIGTTEERREGIASFRFSQLGDTSHLFAAGMKPSVSARFCECYKNEDQRHD